MIEICGAQLPKEDLGSREEKRVRIDDDA